jgi:hypothetical protein
MHMPSENAAAKPERPTLNVVMVDPPLIFQPVSLAMDIVLAGSFSQKAHAWQGR